MMCMLTKAQYLVRSLQLSGREKGAHVDSVDDLCRS